MQPRNFITWLKFNYSNSIDFQLGINIFSTWISSTNSIILYKKKFSYQRTIIGHQVHESHMHFFIKKKDSSIQMFNNNHFKENHDRNLSDYLANIATKIQLWISINVTTFLHFFSLKKLAIEIHTHKATISIIFHKKSVMIIHPFVATKIRFLTTERAHYRFAMFRFKHKKRIAS